VFQSAVIQCGFLNDSSLKCGSARKCWRKLCCKPSMVPIPNITGIHRIINKVVYYITFGKKWCYKCHVFSGEKMTEIGARVQYS
jgi:hypothetical protein